jgi:hypothetical protein
MDHKRNENGAPGSPAPSKGQKSPGNHTREDYAAHLARVTPDAEGNRALLLARYRALHDGGH